MITQRKLDEWRELADAATPGKWGARLDVFAVMHPVFAGHRIATRGAFDDAQAQVDAAFIASAREAVPALLDEVARLAGRVEHLTRQREIDAALSRQQAEYAAELHARLAAAEAWQTKTNGKWMVALLEARAENERLAAIVAQAGAA